MAAAASPPPTAISDTCTTAVNSREASPIRPPSYSEQGHSQSPSGRTTPTRPKTQYAISTKSLPASPVTSPLDSPISPKSATLEYAPFRIPFHIDAGTRPQFKRLSTVSVQSRQSTSSRFSSKSKFSSARREGATKMSNFFNEVVNTTAFSMLKISIAASSGIAVLLSSALYFKQNDLIYPRNFPPESRTDMFTPDKFGVNEWRPVDLRTSDGENLRSYFLGGVGMKKPVTILLFHGNAGNVGHRIPIGKVFSEQLGCNVFMLGYRGYGLSSGKPDEKGLKLDAETALEWILKNPETKNTRIIIYGQSLGGAVGIQTAAKHQDKLSGLVLENTFTSMRDVIPNVFPPAKYLTRLCTQVWPSLDTIPKITTLPILFLSGLRDELVPPEHMKDLYAASRADVRIWQELPNGSHNDSIMEPGYFEYINDFINDEVMRHKKAQ